MSEEHGEWILSYKLLICLALKISEIIEEDLKRNLWYIGSRDINLSSLNKNLLKNKCFRNIVYYRIHEKIKGCL